jgi:hypothetical protein
MDRNDREVRDAAGVGPYAREREKLVPLSTLDRWAVSEGEPDIRGWEVRTVSNRQLGTVSDLLVDPDAGEVVLLDVDLPGSDQHTFVPIRVVQIDRVRRQILMDSADLPVEATTRTLAPPSPGRRASDVGTVTYPRTDRTDREVIVERPRLADNASLGDREGFMASGAERPMVERRRGDRRRIDRISTDL